MKSTAGGVIAAIAILAVAGLTACQAVTPSAPTSPAIAAGDTIRVAENQFPTSLDSDVGFAGYSLMSYGIAESLMRVTPEMASYYADELAQNASRGVVNRISDVKLLQGDLSEAWREDGVDYATLAMRFTLTDSMVDRASGRTVEGGTPSEVTELWTFMRARGGNWLLSAIQQT